MKSPHSLSIACFLFIISCSSFSLAHAAGAGVRTSGGHEFGLSVSSYRYEEPSLSMSIKGDKFGVEHFGTMLLEGDWFIKDDLRFAYGDVDYSSPNSGIKSGVTDWYIDTRGFVGRDIQVGTSFFSPFIGMGYRFLFNDLSGYTSTGSVGYRRESNYLYVPIGMTHRFRLHDGEVLATTLEYDYLLRGKQVSKLSDTRLSGYSDVTNNQYRGFGFRADVMYTMTDWAFGPFIAAWRIDDSNLIQGVGFEPRNRTTEFGLRMKVRF